LEAGRLGKVEGEGFLGPLFGTFIFRRIGVPLRRGPSRREQGFKGLIGI